METTTGLTNSKNCIKKTNNKTKLIASYAKELSDILLETVKLKTPELPNIDKENYKVDSTGWEIVEKMINNSKDTLKVKISPERDIIEFVDGPYKGEQLFKRYGKHIKKAFENGKRFPTKDEWDQLIHSMPYNELIEKFNIKLIGFYEESENEILWNHCNFEKSNQETQFWYRNPHIPHSSPSRTIWFGADQCGYFNDGNGSYDNYCSIRFTDRNLAEEHIAELKYCNDVVSGFFKEVIKDFLKK